MKESKQSLAFLKEMVQKKLSFYLETYGFKSKKERCLEYENGDVRQTIHLAFVDNSKENFTTLIVNLAVRINQVEEMATAFSWANDLTVKEKKNTATLGVQIGKLLDKGQLRWNINDEAECDKVAKEVFNLLKEFGIPYLIENSDINAVLKRFESDNFKEWHVLLNSRAIRLPIIYVLLDRIDDALIELVKQYKLLLQSDDYLAPAYPQFVKELCDRMNIANPIGK
jgi:hypothetical protein